MWTKSSGGYIDLVGGQYYSITRREGTRAYCDITFNGAPGLVIPKGTAFLTAGGLSYALMAAVALGPEGTGRGRLEAAEAGSAYNVEAGAIDRMYVNLTGLTDYQSEAAAGGTDAESDAALLARIRERVQRPPTSGNGYQYRQWAMEIPGVGNAKVVELPGGPGTVGVTLVDSNDRAPSEEIVEAVEAHIEEERPVGAAVTVAAATEREVTVAAQVSLTGGAGLEPSRTPSGRRWRAICTPSLRASTARCTTSPPTTSPTRCSITGCWPCCSMWRGWRTSPPSPSMAAPPT